MRAMGIDIGTTTISVIVIDTETGASLGTRTIAHKGFIDGHLPVSRVQDPEKLWKFTEEAVCELMEECGKVDSIGLTGQMHGMLYVDAAGNAASPLYIWQDGCGNEKTADGRTYAEVLRETGGAASTGFGLVSHYYLQMNNMIPESAVKMVTVSDYMGMKLCGSADAVIATDMAASWGCYDLEKKEFLVAELEKLGVETSYLPTLLKEHEIMGTTVGNVPNGIPVMVSLGDNQASVLGSVSDVCDTVLVNIGTGSQVSVGTENYIACGGAIELRPCVEGTELLVGSGLCGGRSYAMLEQFYREVTGSEEALYEVMEKQAREFKAANGSDAAWKIRTTFSGTRSNPEERGSIQNIGTGNFTPAAMTLGMLKGVLEELHEMYVVMCDKKGSKPTKLVGSGNGIRRNTLLQELAEEMFGMKLMIPVCKEEAAYGAALYSLVAAGIENSLHDVQKKIRYEM